MLADAAGSIPPEAAASAASAASAGEEPPRLPRRNMKAEDDVPRGNAT